MIQAQTFSELRACVHDHATDWATTENILIISAVQFNTNFFDIVYGTFEERRYYCLITDSCLIMLLSHMLYERQYVPMCHTCIKNIPAVGVGH